jgi:hypothetical protein
LPNSLTEYKIRLLGLSANAVGDAISAASETGVHLPVFASKKQEAIPIPGAFVRVPRKTSDRLVEAQALGARDATASAETPVKKCRLLILGTPSGTGKIRNEIAVHLSKNCIIFSMQATMH